MADTHDNDRVFFFHDAALLTGSQIVEGASLQIIEGRALNLRSRRRVRHLFVPALVARLFDRLRSHRGLERGSDGFGGGRGRRHVSDRSAERRVHPRESRHEAGDGLERVDG